MIVVREVRQILAGAGPSYNPFQRDEVDTSPLWTWLLAAVAFVVGGDIAVVAVASNLVLAVAGLALALLGGRSLHTQLGTTGVLLPVGALVPVAVPGFWDFATSGLECALSLFWLGLVWWLLVSVTDTAGPARLATAAVTIGLGPLVRPDFALATAGFGIALVLIVRPGWRRGLGYAGTAVALPVAYQIFRMGYYGITVPMPALAKEAGSSLWARGFAYLLDFVGAYLLWIPLLLIAVIGARVLRETTIGRRGAVLTAAPVLVGILLAGYVVKVGGDYMHARMWIPVTFALLLPVMSLPVGRRHRIESVCAALVVVWALAAGLHLRPPYHGQTFGKYGIIDERGYEAIGYAGAPSLTTTGSRTHNQPQLAGLAGLTAGTDRTLVLRRGAHADGALWTIPMAPSVPDHSGFFSSNMGVAAAMMPLDGTVIDINGLASPLAGHLLLEGRGRPGHEKWLPTAWVLAAYADPAAIDLMADSREATRAQVLAARHALGCGRLKELMDSVDQPMSVHRFWANLTGSPARTSLRVPADPVAAEHRFCSR